MRFAHRLVFAVFALACAVGSHAQAYPDKPVRVIVPFAAGSGSDVGIRLLADYLSRNSSQGFVVENRPGAGGNLGMAAGAKSAANGYTLITGGLGSNALNQFMYTPAEMGFDPEKDLEPIVLMAKLPLMLAVAPNSPYTSVAALVAAAKARPGTLNVSVTATAARLVVELFGKTTGAPLTVVNYKSSGQAISDVIGGNVQVAVDTVASLRPLVAAGRLKPIAVTSLKATDMLPGVPSVAEQGVNDFEVVGWISLYGPRGMPREAVTYVNGQINKALALPETRKRFQDLGFDAAGGTPQELSSFEIAERNKWGPIIKAAGITAN
jgi:tripartite-type tricarboxylate transporter receptor subunit TctC